VRIVKGFNLKPKNVLNFLICALSFLVFFFGCSSLFSKVHNYQENGKIESNAKEEKNHKVTKKGK